MLVAAADSHGFSANVADSASFAPQITSPVESHSVSLFDLLLSQVVATSYQINPTTSTDNATSNDLPSHSHPLGHTIPLPIPTQSTSTLPSELTSVNPLTSLLFLSNSPSPQKLTTTTNFVSGTTRDQGNVGKDLPETGLSASTTFLVHSPTLHSPTSGSVISVPAAAHRARLADTMKTESSANLEGSPLSSRFTTTRQTIPATGFDVAASTNTDPSGRVTQTFAIHPKESSPNSLQIDSPKLDQKQFEPTLVISESTAENLPEESNSAHATFDQGLIINVESISIESKPAITNSVRNVVPVQHSVEHQNDGLIPMEQMPVVSNVDRSTNQDSSPPISEQIATAITSNLASAHADGTTTVRIRLESHELGTIQLDLSVKKDVVSVRIVTANQQSQQIVESQMTALRLALTTNGVDCGQFQVACDLSNRQLTAKKSSGESSRSTELFSTSRSATSTTLKFPASISNSRVSFVA